MKINEKILEILTSYSISKDDAICYLISLFYDYNPSYIPQSFKDRVAKTRIAVIEYKKNDEGEDDLTEIKDIKWNLPLYEGAETAFEWVKTEYVPMFKERNTDRGGKVREATARMKKLFAKNPDVRKDDVIGATRMYLRNTNPDYIRFPHYFIEKGTAADKTNDILDWLDKYALTQEDSTGRTSTSNTMQ